MNMFKTQAQAKEDWTLDEIKRLYKYAFNSDELKETL